MNKDEGVSPPGARGSAYIVPSSECGSSDQTDINLMIFLDPFGRWSIIREMKRDWPQHLGGRPRGEGGRCWVFLTSLPKVDVVF